MIVIISQFGGREQWTGNPKAAGSIPAGRQFFALLVLSSRRSGGSSLGFRAGSL